MTDKPDDEMSTPEVRYTPEQEAAYSEGWNAAKQENAFEMRSHLGVITAQLTYLSHFVQSVKSFLELLWWCVVGAVCGYAIGKLMVAIVK